MLDSPVSNDTRTLLILQEVQTTLGPAQSPGVQRARETSGSGSLSWREREEAYCSQVRTSRSSWVCPQKSAISSHRANSENGDIHPGAVSQLHYCPDHRYSYVAPCEVLSVLRSHVMLLGLTATLQSCCSELPLLSWDAFLSTPGHF
ncbi:sarcolipin isoform X1 [Canis lupus familiaris]|uniref:sarcolipin isoform X1 n=1 Tax=Canis lupus familiaris TaxID=9615 RepID=UPI0018F3950F|nr:sarcolipin isoform X1 [Canis lupus familiaris]XP_038391445.1 sarcolipin isoform X1 [Canis lupus familiaris]XP_038520193.1 sarcolipin isoform X1 [Canis lupus familiaris]XP_048965977.1 sarcolipin isoform X1 [Canis lupus dingo]